MSERDQPGPTHTPYGQDPVGQQPGYGPAPQADGDRRPGTVTAAAWITIIFSALTAALFGFTGLALLVARDEVVDQIDAEMASVPEWQDANIDPDAIIGVLTAFMIGLVIWCLIVIVLAVLVLRRSNVSRILLVISASVAALFSLVTIGSGVTLVPLIATIAVIVLLFTGGAGDWFKRLPAGGYAGYTGYPGGYPATTYGDPYGQQAQQQAQQPAQPQYPDPYANPYGTQPGQPGQAGQADSPNPYGQYPQGPGPETGDRDDGDHPPQDHPGR